MEQQKQSLAQLFLRMVVCLGALRIAGMRATGHAVTVIRWCSNCRKRTQPISLERRDDAGRPIETLTCNECQEQLEFMTA
jgi:hypothetical protein